MTLSPIFLSHGAPTIVRDDVPAGAFLSGLGKTMPRPKAILAVSAHWDTPEPRVNSVSVNDTIHDFRGFPPELYALSYPAPGDPLLAGRVADLLAEAGFDTLVDERRGLDHGAWAPLMLAWPDADIPVVQLSVQSRRGPAHHLALGRAIAPLIDEDVLILTSGNFTHDLSSIDWRGNAPEPEWVHGFAEWMVSALDRGDTDALLAYRALAPHAVHNHPTEDHLVPLYVALGAAGPGAIARHLHNSVTFGVLRMDAYAFDPEASHQDRAGGEPGHDALT